MEEWTDMQLHPNMSWTCCSQFLLISHFLSEPRTKITKLTYRLQRPSMVVPQEMLTMLTVAKQSQTVLSA